MAELKDQVQHALGDVYRLEDELTGGGMSRLFLATEVSLNRRVVVKVLPPEWASDVSAARFKREMEVAAQLQHPHILPVLAAGARTGLLYYIMPFVAGESLRATLKRDGALPIEDARRILCEIADAMAFAHDRGVIHRDIKPENILLEGRHAVLADFGVARAVLEARNPTERLTSTGSSVGTPGYMSPEQMAGDAIDARADVYALAVVGYEMIAGRPPFTGPTAQAILRAHMTDTPDSLRVVRPECPPELDAAIARALGKEPAQRFASAAEFLRALSDQSDPPGRSLRPLVSRRVVGGAAAAALLIAIAAFFYVDHLRARDVVRRAMPAAEERRLDDVAALLDSAGVEVGQRGYGALASRVAALLVVEDDGATISLARVTPVATFGQRMERSLGEGPLRRRVVAGEYLLRAVTDRDTVERLVSVGPGDSAIVRMPEAGPVPGMVRIAAGRSPSGRSIPGFAIGRYEVTNAEFQRFVNAGGYRQPAHWPDSMFVAGRWRARDAALATFMDRSGLPGPRGWSGGKHAPETERLPVVSVSWYEANAYARWASARLPTAAQWWRGALGDGDRAFPWGNDGLTVEQRANFGLLGPRPVGSMRAGVSPFGLHDMAGNVREWIADVTDAHRRTVVGGSWQDPTYMFERQHAESFDAGYASPAIGFRIVRPTGPN